MMERGWRHEQFSQWEGEKGEKGHPKQGAAGRFNWTTPRALLSQALSACASIGHDANLVLGLVVLWVMVRW